jgi:hypothetical protein
MCNRAYCAMVVPFCSFCSYNLYYI